MSAKNTEDPSAQRELMSRSLGSAVFPFESSAEAHFHQEVLLAAQRWISAHGWPGGPFPVTVPQTLRWWVVASCFILPGGVEQISIFLQLIDAFLITYALHSFRSYFRIISFELCHSFQSRHPYPIRWWWHRCECEEGSYGERKRQRTYVKASDFYIPKTLIAFPTHHCHHTLIELHIPVASQWGTSVQ